MGAYPSTEAYEGGPRVEHAALLRPQQYVAPRATYSPMPVRNPADVNARFREPRADPLQTSLLPKIFSFFEPLFEGTS